MEGPQDVLDRGLTMYLVNGAATTKFFFQHSPDPLMRRVYQEASVAKGALITSTGSTGVPDYIVDNVNAGTAAMMWERGYQVFDGDEYYYSVNSITKLPSAFVETFSAAVLFYTLLLQIATSRS